MPSAAAAAAAATTGHHHSTRRRLPGVTILALCMLTAGWIAFTVLASSPDYTDFESQATHFDAVAGRGDSHDASRGSGAAPPTLLHRIGLAAGAGKQRVELAVDPSTADDEALAFTVQHNNIPSSNAFSHAAAPRSARDSLTNKLRIKLDRTATLLGNLLLGLFGIDDGAEWFSEGDFDYETSQSGLDGGTLSSWSESSVYVERTNSLHPSRPSSFGPHILDEPLRGYLYPVEYASATDAYACSSTAVAPVPVTPAAPWIALIQRGKCPFSEKVRFAQHHGAEAVVFGDQSEGEGGIAGGHGLLTPWSPENTDDIKIPSTFVSRASYLSLIRTWKDEQDIVKQMRGDSPPPMQDGSTQTSISPRDAATEYVGLEVVLSKDEMLASPFLDLLFVLLFLPSLLTLVTVFVQRIRLARAAQAERAPKDAVARLPVFRWGDHVVPPPVSSSSGATSAAGASSSSAGAVAAPEKPTGRSAPSDEEREIGVEAGRAPRLVSPRRRVSSSNEDVSEPDEATTLLPHSSSSAPLTRSSSASSSSALAPSLAQRAFARLPFVVQRFLPSFIRPPVPATPASARSSRLNNAVPTRRFPSIVECPFCLCDFENGDTVMELPCGHLFHDEEVRGWLEGQKGVCPVCRTSVLNPAPIPSSPPAPAAAVPAASVTVDEPTGGGGSPRASSTRTDTTVRPTPTTSTDLTSSSSSRAPITAGAPIASTSSVRIDDGGGRPRSL